MNREESLKEMMRKDEQYGIYKELTAVQWLVEQVNSDCLNSTFIKPDIIEQAIDMEMKQLEQFYNHAIFAAVDTGHGEQFIDYYTRKFIK